MLYFCSKKVLEYDEVFCIDCSNLFAAMNIFYYLIYPSLYSQDWDAVPIYELVSIFPKISNILKMDSEFKNSKDLIVKDPYRIN